MGGLGTALLMSFQALDQSVPGSPAIVMQEATAVVFG
jgi:G:T-mismatch repair DNA endonuclease (very short patch repair protein)